jgi:hypothetical protein
VAQAVEHLLFNYKHKALSSNPSPTPPHTQKNIKQNPLLDLQAQIKFQNNNSGRLQYSSLTSTSVIQIFAGKWMELEIIK